MKAEGIYEFRRRHLLQWIRGEKAGVPYPLLSIRAVGRQCRELRQCDRRDNGPIVGHCSGGLLSGCERNVIVEALYHEDGEYRYEGGWNLNALIAVALGARFSSVLPKATNLLPSWWGTYGWVFGVAIGGVVYYSLSIFRPRPVPATKAS